MVVYTAFFKGWIIMTYLKGTIHLCDDKDKNKELMDLLEKEFPDIELYFDIDKKNNKDDCEGQITFDEYLESLK